MMKIDLSELSIPKFKQPEVLSISGLAPKVLQTWVGRNVIKLDQQNPGKGKSRLYSSLDIVKLAIMRRGYDLHLTLARSVDLANSSIDYLKQKGGMEWDLRLVLRPIEEAELERRNISVRHIGGFHALSKYFPAIDDPLNENLARVLEAAYYPETRVKLSLGEQMEQRKKQDEDLKNAILMADPSFDTSQEHQDRRELKSNLEVDSAKREYFARGGVFAEPVIVFPLGNTINGTLLMIDNFEKEGSK